jgi:hypothetical protein
VRGKVESGPFGNNALSYTGRGWPVIPVHPQSKECAVVGYTGRDGKYPTLAEVTAWTDEYSGHNIAIRLPRDIIGIDVDAYDGRLGYETLQEREAELGELPRTYVITSRGGDTSGIRLFRVPTGKNWKGTAGAGIDVLTWYHRYAVVFPSVHPQTGNEYAWYHEKEDGTFRASECPSYTDDIIPDLPREWQDWLSGGTSAASKVGKLNRSVVDQWIREYGGGQPCAMMNDTTGKYINKLVDAEDKLDIAHNSMVEGQRAIVGDGMAGHSGMARELTRLRAAFLDAVCERRERSSAEQEWQRALYGVVRLFFDTPREDGDPCRNPAALIQLRSAATGKLIDPRARALEKEIEAEQRRIHVKREAERNIRAIQNDSIEKPVIMNMAAWLARDMNEPLVLVDGLIPLEGNTLLVAQPKAGKTTLVHNLIRAVADSHKFIGLPVHEIPDNKRLVLLDFEMHEGMLHSWMLDQGIRNPRNASICSLYGRGSSFNILDPFCWKDWCDRLEAANAGYVVLDCLAPAWAAVGVDENSNTEVGEWLDKMSELVIACGAYGMMLIHHTGRQGEHARGASRIEGWTSDNLRLTLQAGGEDDDGKFVSADRFLSARGRIASEFGERILIHNPETRWLTSEDKDRNEIAAERVMPAVALFIKQNPMTSKNAIANNVKGNRNAVYRAIDELLSGDTQFCCHKGKNNSSIIQETRICTHEDHGKKYKV